MIPNRISGTILLVLLLASSLAVAAPGGEVRLAPARSWPLWVGQELELHLELWSDGFTFGGQSFVLPDVSGAFLMQADSSTVKLSEVRDGVTWQGLRYTLLLYPQRAGRLVVPPFDVRFNVSAGYGAPASSFALQTEPLTVEARLPPGVSSGHLLVTSSRFSMESSWTPRPGADGTLQLKVGDALNLEVVRRAADVPGMVFEPLPDFATDGLGVYPQAPEVEDRINRGELTGTRRDAVTFLCEREGSYTLPEVRFRWWDPESKKLEEAVIPALHLEVSPNPALAAQAALNERPRGFRLVLALSVALAAFLAWWVRPGLAEWVASRRQRRQSTETWAFRQVQRACRLGRAPEAYRAINRWLPRFCGGGGTVTLLRLAELYQDAALRDAAVALQERLATDPEGNWDGGALLQRLQALRRNQRQARRSTGVLPALNPD